MEWGVFAILAMLLVGAIGAALERAIARASARIVEVLAAIQELRQKVSAFRREFDEYASRGIELPGDDRL